MRIPRPVLILAMIGVLALAGSVSSAPARQEIVIAGEADVVQFDPLRIQELPTSFIAGMVMERLVMRTVDGRIVGQLAERWKLSVDRRTWTFSLRQGVKFHDGSEFDASVVEWHLRRVLDPREGSVFRAQFSDIERIQVVDRHTIAITLKQANVAFLDLVLLTNGGLIPSKAAYDSLGREFPFKPIGTGPFRFVQWVQGQRVVLGRNLDWWGGQVKPDQLVIRPITEVNTSIIELETGGVHFITRANREDLERLSKDRRFVVHRVPSYRIRYINLNTAQAPLNDIRVRQAVNHAINTPQIIKALADGMAVPMDSILPAGSAFNPKPGTYTSYPFNRAKARSLLDEAGWRPGPGGIAQKDGQSLRLVLHTPNGRYFMDKEICEVACNQLRAVGFDCQVNVMEWAAFLSDVRGGRFQAAFNGWNQSTDEPSLFMDALVKTGGRANYSKTSDPALDQILTEALIAFSEGRRKLLYNRAVDMVNKIATMVPINTEYKVAITSGRLEGYTHGAPQTGVEFVNAYLK